MFNSRHYENSREDGHGVLEIAAEDGNGGFVPLKETKVSGSLTGPLASICVTQTFLFTKEQRKDAIEAVYRFPLPGDAAVMGVKIKFGKNEIVACLKGRERAKAEYEEAKAEGKQAALTVRNAPDVFTLNVSGIQPGEPVTVKTSYVQNAKREGKNWSLRVPLTTAPRYNNGVADDKSPLMALRDPGHKFSVDIKVFGAASVSSPTHDIKEGQRSAASILGVRRISLKEKTLVPDKDFVLRWAHEGDDSPELQVYEHDDKKDPYRYFAALVAPPATGKGRSLARETLILVDHSGSMEGAKWKAADWAVRQYLSRMDKRDLFNLCIFHSGVYWYQDKPVYATEENKAAASDFLSRKDSGGTNLGGAIFEALAMKEAPGHRSKHVLVITDGQVASERECVELVKKNAKDRRVSVICIDSAPNSFLACEMAEKGGGQARFLTGNSGEGDITTALNDIMKDWDEPICANMRLTVCDGVEAVGRRTLEYDVDMGDLPAGRAAWVCGRIPRDSGEPAYSLRIDGDKKEGRTESGMFPAIKALFGAHKVNELEYELAQMRWTASDEDKQEAEDKLAKEALYFGLPSSQTSFVGVSVDAKASPKETVVVPSALPDGWADSNETIGLAVANPTYFCSSVAVADSFGSTGQTGPTGCCGGMATGMTGATGMSLPQFYSATPQFYSASHIPLRRSLESKGARSGTSASGPGGRSMGSRSMLRGISGCSGFSGSGAVISRRGAVPDYDDLASPEAGLMVFEGKAKKGVLFDSDRDKAFAHRSLSGISIEGLDRDDSLADVMLAVYVDGDNVPFALISLSEFLIGERPIAIASFSRLRIELDADYGKDIKIHLNK